MDKIWGILRHGLGLAGGVLIGLGVADNDAVNSVLTNGDTIVGAIGGLIAVGTSIYTKLEGFKWPWAN